MRKGSKEVKAVAKSDMRGCYMGEDTRSQGLTSSESALINERRRHAYTQIEDLCVVQALGQPCCFVLTGGNSEQYGSRDEGAILTL